VHATSVSSDGTTKLLLRLSDGHVIETVAIPSLRKRATEGDGHTRWTACVSSQVGCPMRCSFCATGKGGYARQLAAHEIVDQVLAASATGAAGGARPANVVFMGMGEPLLNLKAVLPALRTLQDRLGIGARKITVSTVGVPNAIGRLAAERSQVGLAVSLHAPTQALRESLVPSAKAYPLDALLADCVGYFEATGRRVRGGKGGEGRVVSAAAAPRLTPSSLFSRSHSSTPCWPASTTPPTTRRRSPSS
jgi:23S rRNA (adenine2503-C2)-methyltransferase